MHVQVTEPTEFLFLDPKKDERGMDADLSLFRVTAVRPARSRRVGPGSQARAQPRGEVPVVNFYYNSEESVRLGPPGTLYLADVYGALETLVDPIQYTIHTEITGPEEPVTPSLYSTAFAVVLLFLVALFCMSCLFSMALHLVRAA
jgi:hypothetical protein